jgi:hypothetical protein
MESLQLKNIRPDDEHEPHLVLASLTVTEHGRTPSFFDHSGTRTRTIFSVSEVYQ